ncbi:hypothetical protein COTS27_00617 [Spirochaetota bacterium]|nr:hypothetical protein COTS27_00617 [Spirochaetota bacterium]
MIPEKDDLIKTEELAVGAHYDMNLFIGEDCIFLEKDMPIEEQDITLLKKWKLDNLYTKSYLQSERKFNFYFREQIKEFRNFSRCFLNDVGEFYETIRLNYSLTMPDFDKHFDTILTFYRNPANFFSFYANSELRSEKYEEIALLTAFYVIMLGTRLNLKEADLKLLFYAAIFADIGFQKKSELSILEEYKSSGTPPKFSIEDNDYLNSHIKASCSILKEKLSAPSELVYLVLTQHIHLDKSSPLKLPPDKITFLARIFSLSHNFVYLFADFLKPFRPPALLANAVLTLLKHKERYDNKVLKNFLTVNSFFPPGQLLLLEDKKVAVSIKATYRDPKRPIVEVIKNPKKIGVSDTETINLAEENLKIIALIDSPKIRQKSIRSIYAKI